MKASQYRLASIVLAVLILVFLLALFKFKLFSVTDIDVSQNQVGCVGTDEVKKAANVYGQNIFLVDAQKVSQNIRNKFPCVDSLQIERRMPNKITLKVEGRTPIARIESVSYELLSNLNSLEASPSSTSALLDWSFPEIFSGQLFLVDKQGVIFSGFDGVHLPIIFASEQIKTGQILSENLFAGISDIFSKLFELKIFVKGLPDDKSPKVKLLENSLLIDTQNSSEGGIPKLVFSLEKDVKPEVASLQLIFQKAKIDGRKIESIDLRFDKPVVIYAPQKK